MVFKIKKGVVGLATGLLLVGLLINPANAGTIYAWTSPPAEWGWAGVYEEDGDDDVAAFLLWGFAVAALWPNGTGGWGALQPPVKPPPTEPPGPIDPPSGGGGGDDPVVPEAGPMALVVMGVIAFLALRRRQK